MEKVSVEFSVTSRLQFEDQLNGWTQDSRSSGEGNPCPSSTVQGYRIDDGVDRREALKKFVDQMELKLRKNEHKSNWRDKSIEALFRLMLIELEEFKVHHEFFDVKESRPELVDLANFALILWDRLGMLDQDKPAGVQT